MRFKAPSLVAVLALAAVVAGSALWTRGRLRAWTQGRAASALAARLATLPDRQAAELLRQLAMRDDQWLPVLVRGLTDARPAVGSAAANALDRLADDWSALEPRESSPRVAELARLLAEHAPQLPADRIARTQSLAQRLLTWPVDCRRLDAAQLVADCETVLRLSLAAEMELRVAAMPLKPAAGINTAPVSAVPMGNSSPPTEPAVPSLLVAPRGQRISDD